MMQQTVSNTMSEELFAAAMADDAARIASLVAAGADVACHDEHGRTCLHHAAQRGLTRSIQALVAAGADPNQLDTVGWPAINLAAWNDRFDAIAELVSCGARTDIADDRRYLAIDLAMTQGWPKSTLMLRGCGSPAPSAVKVENEQFAEILALPPLEAAVLCSRAQIVDMAMKRAAERGDLNDAQIQAAAERAEQANKVGPSTYLRSLLAQKAARAAVEELGLELRGVAP